MQDENWESAAGLAERKSLPTTKKTLLVKVTEMEDNLRGITRLNERIQNNIQKSWEI